MLKKIIQFFSLKDEKTNDITLVFYYNTNGVWLGECLDYDIGAQGNTLGIAIDRLIRILKNEYDTSTEGGKEPFHNLMYNAEYIKPKLLDNSVILIINEKNLKDNFKWQFEMRKETNE
jgi:hypothetical protein